MKFEDYVELEKSFLHDLSNHLVVMDAVARYLNNHDFNKSNLFSEKDKEKIEKLSSSVDKMITSLQSRKNFVLTEYKKITSG